MEGPHSRIIIVTTAYHVFRALLREFIGYLWMTWKRHALVVGVVAGIIMIGNMIG